MPLLPDNWTRARLGDVCTLNPKGKPDLALDTLVSFVPMSAVDATMGEVTGGEPRPLSDVLRGYTPFRDGDVIFAKITPCMENGKAAVARGLINGWGYGSTEFHVLRPGPQVTAEWLFFLLRTQSFRNAAAGSFQGGVGQQRVPESYMRAFSIPLPPLSEQRRIVEILQEAEEVRRLQAEADAKAAKLITEAFHASFGGGRAPVSRPLDELVEEFRYGTSHKSGDRGLLTLRIPNVIGARVSYEDLVRVATDERETERLRLVDGDMLFVRTNGNPDYVGRCGVFRQSDVPACIGRFEPFIYASYLIRARFRQGLVHPRYLHAYMNTAAGRAAVLRKARTAAGQYNINIDGLSSLSIPVAPFDRQAAFAGFAEECDALSTQHRDALVGERYLGASLLAHAFTGELTAAWRAERSAELAAEAAERDAALKEHGVAVAAPTRPAPAVSTAESRRDPRCAYLNRAQRELLAGIEKHFPTGCFTPETLIRELGGRWSGNPHTVESHLLVLAARGLVIAFSREEQREDTGEVVYGTAYRLPTEEHETPDGESIPGDRVRGREIGRLGAQLEKERML